MKWDAIDSIFVIHQKQTVSKWNSHRFRQVMKDYNELRKAIEVQISEDEAQNILNIIRLPEALESRYLIRTQLNIYEDFFSINLR